MMRIVARSLAFYLIVLVFSQSLSAQQSVPTPPANPSGLVEDEEDQRRKQQEFIESQGGGVDEDFGGGDVPPPPMSGSAPSMESDSSPQLMGVPQVEREVLPKTNKEAEQVSESNKSDPALESALKPEDVSTQKLIEARMERRKKLNSSDRVFGTYKLGIGLLQPTFASQNNYEKFYGSSSRAPTISVGVYPIDWYVTLGLFMRATYYRDRGNALKKSDNDYVKDPDSSIEFTTIPLQLGAAIQFTPFDSKWIAVQGWAGFEYADFSETRAKGATSTESEDENKVYTTKGVRNGIVLGGGLDIRIDQIEPDSADSLGTIGMRHISISPFFETVQAIGNEKFNLERTSIGLAFSFETIL